LLLLLLLFLSSGYFFRASYSACLSHSSS
jgi:hypothetical protein